MLSILMQRSKHHIFIFLFLSDLLVFVLIKIISMLISRYIELVRKHGLEISQPGLQPDRGLTWQMTKRRGDQEVHK